jgi:hypothetical protein
VNGPADPHQPGDSYILVANLTGVSGKLYSIPNPQIGQEINLFPNLDLAVLKIPDTPQDQPYAPLEYADKAFSYLTIVMRQTARSYLGITLGGCRRAAIFDEESVTYRRRSVRNVLILRRGNSNPDRLLWDAK